MDGASRIAELANGELLVGTSAGALWLVTSFGETVQLGTLGEGPILELTADPVGRFWARTQGGSIYAGGLWSSPVRVAEGARLLIRGCEETHWLSAGEGPLAVTASALSNTCDRYVDGSTDGRIGHRPVTAASIVRLQSHGQGVLWVDSSQRAGCLDCAVNVPATGVVDAIVLHIAPFVAGEVAWIDVEGGLWLGSG